MMSELERVAARKKVAQRSARKKSRRAGKLIIGGLAVGGGVAAATLFAKRSKKRAGELVIPDNVTPERDPVARATAASRRKLEWIIANSLSTAETAALLTSSANTVTRQIRAHVLYGFSINHVWLLPKFQFRGERPIRNLGLILSALNPDLHPIEVVNWFTRSSVDLVLNDTSVSPVDWLEAGGDPQVVIAVAQQVGSGL